MLDDFLTEVKFVFVTGDGDSVDIRKWIVSEHFEVRARVKAGIAKPFEEIRGSASDPDELEFPAREFVHASRIITAHESLVVGNRIAMRIPRRQSEHFIDAVDEPLADRMLEHLGLFVNLGPIEIQNFDEERFKQPVTAENLHHRAVAGVAENNPLARPIIDEALPLKLLHHGGSRSGRHLDRLRNFANGSEQLLISRELVNCLQIVLAGAGGHLAGSGTCRTGSVEPDPEIAMNREKIQRKLIHQVSR